MQLADFPRYGQTAVQPIFDVVVVILAAVATVANSAAAAVSTAAVVAVVFVVFGFLQPACSSGHTSHFGQSNKTFV